MNIYLTITSCSCHFSHYRYFFLSFKLWNIYCYDNHFYHGSRLPTHIAWSIALVYLVSIDDLSKLNFDICSMIFLIINSLTQLVQNSDGKKIRGKCYLIFWSQFFTSNAFSLNVNSHSVSHTVVASKYE